MSAVVISGTGLYQPPYTITNAELVEAFNAYVDRYNAEHAAEIEAGTLTALLTARVSARSKPDLVPSRSMLVSKISPAPRCAISVAQATASSPVFLRPPWL